MKKISKIIGVTALSILVAALSATSCYFIIQKLQTETGQGGGGNLPPITKPVEPVDPTTFIRNEYEEYNFDGTSEIKVDISSLGDTTKNYFAPEEVKFMTTKHGLENDYIYNTQRLNNIGEANVAVIPVMIPGYELKDEQKETVRHDIKNAIFGKSEDTGFESVSSYYYKSSYGQVNIGGYVTDWYYPDPNKYPKANSITEDGVIDILNSAVDHFGLHTPNLDGDKDGFIDAVYLVYSAPTFNQYNGLSDNYWAYTFWDQSVETTTLSNPQVNAYMWASIEFMYNSNLENLYNGKVDAHTYIHETGHLFGLNDYYDYNNGFNMTRSPAGDIDMMDLNIIDHNSYSKMLLGWTKPYIVLGDAEITLKSNQEKNQCIVIPKDNTSYTINGNEIIFNPFSEYIVIEYYTPEGLNYLDSVKGPYVSPTSSPIRGFRTSGLRMYYVDARMFVFTDSLNRLVTEFRGTDLNILKDNQYICELVTNTSGGERAEMASYRDFTGSYNAPSFSLKDSFNELTLIRADFSNFTAPVSDKALFTESNNLTFSMNNYAKYFNNGLFNGGGKSEAVVNIVK